MVSIHAPRVGRDARILIAEVRRFLFQSTRPVWGATHILWIECKGKGVSIHAPRVGRDHAAVQISADRYRVSIHAPRVGRDRNKFLRIPRSAGFQSTRPVWGATHLYGQ